MSDVDENQSVQESAEETENVNRLPENSRPPVFIKPQAPQATEHDQEAKLKARFPNLQGGRGSAMLQKRLHHGQKFFDSGDYYVAMAKIKNPKQPLNPTEKLILKETIGGAIPTPENVPQRKSSLIQSKLAAGEFT